MNKLKELVEKRREAGKKKCEKQDYYKAAVEYEELSRLIIEEVYRMYDDGELN